MDALIARYDGAGDGARIGAADFCERLAARRFGPRAPPRRRSGARMAWFRRFAARLYARSRVVATTTSTKTTTRRRYRRATRSPQRRPRRGGGEVPDARRVRAARAAAATRWPIPVACASRLSSRRASDPHTRGGGPGSSGAPFREPTGFEAAGGRRPNAPVSARTPPSPGQTRRARFLRMARGTTRGARAKQVALRDHEMRASERPGPARVRHAGQLPPRDGVARPGTRSMRKRSRKRAAKSAKEASTRRGTPPPPSAVRRRSCARSFPRASPWTAPREEPCSPRSSSRKRRRRRTCARGAWRRATSWTWTSSARVATPGRLSRRRREKRANETTGRELDYAARSHSCRRQPGRDVRKAVSPTPAVDHCATEALARRIHIGTRPVGGGVAAVRDGLTKNTATEARTDWAE